LNLFPNDGLTKTGNLLVRKSVRHSAMAEGELMLRTVSSINDHGHNRECVGIHLAKSTLWLTVASILAVFDLNAAKDEQGREIEVVYEAVGNLIQ
jgi:hypothetical protein